MRRPAHGLWLPSRDLWQPGRTPVRYLDRDRDRDRDGASATRASGGGGGAPAAPQILKLTKTFTVAELNTIGASQSGRLSMGAELPAGSIPIAAFMRNLGNAFTSSGGSITFANANMFNGASATVGLFSGNVIDNWHSANWMTQDPVSDDSAIGASGASDRDTFNSWTPYVLFNVGGSGVTFANLTGGAAGLEITLVYMLSTVKKVTKTFTRAEIAALGGVNIGRISMGTELPAGALPIAMAARAFQAHSGTSAALRVGITNGDQTATTIGPAGTGVSSDAAYGAASGITRRLTGVFAHDFFSAWTPYAQFSLSSGSLSGLTGGLTGGVEVVLYYIEPDDGYRLTKTVTLAEINALGAATSGHLSMLTELPAGSLPLFNFSHNKGAAAASVSGLNAAITRDGEAGGGAPACSIIAENRADAGPVTGWAALLSSGDLNFYEAWTPHVRMTTSGGNLNAVTGLNDDAEVNLIYVPGAA